MAMNTATNVQIIPGRLSSLATLVRADLNATCASARTGNKEEMEEYIKCLRLHVTRLCTEAELVVEEA